VAIGGSTTTTDVKSLIPNSIPDSIATYHFPPGQLDASGKYVMNQPTKIYADPGTVVFFDLDSAHDPNPPGTFVCRATLKGNLPTP
jgi:hypothetical protein